MIRLAPPSPPEHAWPSSQTTDGSTRSDPEACAGRPGVEARELTPLVLRTQQGDPEGSPRSLPSSAAVLRALTALLGREHPEIEDLAQDVLLAVIAALLDFRGDSTLLHFAVRIAARKSVLARWRTRSVLGWLESLWRGEFPPASGPSSAHEAMRGVIDSEPCSVRCSRSYQMGRPRHRCCASCAAIRIEEISTLTQTPFNTVRSRLRLAKEALRQRIEAELKWAELGQEKP